MRQVDFLFFISTVLCSGVFVRFSAKGVQKLSKTHTQKTFGKNPFQKLSPKS
jgi:hypothetical protein